ncbi:PAS domain S-box-containing protein [Pedobacter sp. W3I1]|uniref:sensor histidine kinase n=1 Tax=Pedobacter sp. W3I1 TaxID=3042291 RepID=UPI0027867BDE|nr:PAS domain S-box protein [Pedobacter sp. W3I1]MDQ0638354.1 PAS domain S-box-containing protein [Pedobacter sp. W3I1]
MDFKSVDQLFTFRSIFQGLEDAIICHDLNFNITNTNPAAERLFGFSKDGLVGKTAGITMPKGIFKEYERVAVLVLGGEKVHDFRTVRQTASGTEIQVSITLSPVSDDEGKIIGLIQMIRDLSGGRDAEEQQARLAAIIEGSEDAIVSKTLDGFITSWNKGAQEMFGYTPAEAIGKHITMLIPPDRITEEDYIIGNVRAGKKIEHYKTVRLAKNGREIPISLTVSALRDKNGHIIGVSKIARNITAQKLADEKQATLAAIVQSSDDAIISKTLAGVISTWNKGAENIFGYTETEAVGQHISILIPQNRLDEEERIINSIKRGEKIDHFQTIRLSKENKEIQVSLTVSPIKNSEGVIIGASKVARDITAQREAEIALEYNAQKLLILNTIGKTISEQLDVEVILQKVTDATTELTSAAFGAFFYNKTNVDGESYMLYTLSGAPREAFEKFGTPRNTAVFHTTFSGGGIVRVDDITKDPRYGKMAPHFGMPKGHLPVVSYLAVPVISATGNVIGGLFFGHPEPGRFLKDHEELVAGVASQAAIALDNSKLFEEVKTLSRKKDEFIALASHELKTPITAMGGFLQLLQKTATGEVNRNFVNKAMGQLDKINLLINDLFDISKVQSGKLQFNFESLNLGGLISDICETFAHSVPQHNFIFEPSGELTIEGDRMRLEQVITNLIGNAVKYAPQSPDISINAVNQNNEITVSIIDNGAGIPQAEQTNIFSQFYRVREQDRHISGLGLGLYITREIIERHGGRIWVESEMGKGAAFKFVLPLQQ